MRESSKISIIYFYQIFLHFANTTNRKIKKKLRQHVQQQDRSVTAILLDKRYNSQQNLQQLGNHIAVMSRKVMPEIKVREISRTYQSNQSNNSINNSYLHNGYLSYRETTVSRCFQCKSSLPESLMSVCDCEDRLFHQDCLKQWLRYQLKAHRGNIKTDDDISSLKCDQCSYQIKFKFSSRCRMKSLTQLHQYCSRHKGLTFAMILTITLILACLTIILLLQCGTLSISNEGLTKEVTLIALLVISGLLLLVMGCCCLDCLRTSDKHINTMYNREGKSHKSSRAAAHGFRKDSNATKLVVESIQ